MASQQSAPPGNSEHMEITSDEKPIMKSISNPLRASIDSSLCGLFSISLLIGLVYKLPVRAKDRQK